MRSRSTLGQVIMALALAGCGAPGSLDIASVGGATGCLFDVECGEGAICTASACAAGERPSVVSALPDGGAPAAAEVVVRLVFSTAMDVAATGQAFALSGAGGVVAGTQAWDGSGAVLAFRPEAELADGTYTIELAPDASSVGGVELGVAFAHAFTIDGRAGGSKP